MIRKLTKTVVFAIAVMSLVTTFAVAADMTCSKDDGKNCTMAKDAMGKEVAVIGMGAEMGDKIDCASKDPAGRMVCKKVDAIKK